MLRRLAKGWSEVTNAEPGQRALHAVHKPGAFLDQALALPIGPLGVLFGKRRYAHHAAMAPVPPQPAQKPPLEQFGVEPIGLGPSMFPRYRDTRGVDHMRLDTTRLQPARQPETVAPGFEGQRNPRDCAAGLYRLVAPAMQQGKQSFWTRLQLLARLTFDARKHTANQPARLAQLEDGNDRAILVQGDEGPAQVIRLGHCGTPSVRGKRRSCHVLAARPIASPRPKSVRRICWRCQVVPSHRRPSALGRQTSCALTRDRTLMQGGLYDPVPPSSIPLLSRRMRAFSGMPRDFQAGRQATKLWTEACQSEFESAPSCGEAKRTPIRPAALRGSRISETHETTKGSAELKFRIQSSPADSPSLSGFRLRPRKDAGFPPLWRPFGAAVSAETRKVQQPRAEEG